MAKIKRYTNGSWEEILVAPEVTDVVKITPQELTDAEKEQARENIRAASIEDVNNLLAESRGALGKAWIQSNISSPEFTSICSDGNMWMACSRYGDRIYYSTDGKTWLDIGFSGQESISCVYYANGLWMTADAYGMYSSTDGREWNSIASYPGINDIYYANNTWIAAGNNNIYYSFDGTTWESITFWAPEFTEITYPGGIFGKVRYGGDHWIAISKECQDSSINSSYGTAYSTSDSDVEGGFWRECNIYTGEYASKVFDRYEILNDVHYAEGLWVLAGPKSTGGLYYVDDENVYYGDWHTTTMDVPSGFNCVYNGNGHWVAGSIDNGIYYSTDGITWTQTNIKSGTFLSLHYANGLWVAGSTNGTFFSEDGITWSQGAGLSGNVNDILFAGEDWIAAVGKGLYYSVPFSDDLQGVYDMAKGYADSLVPSVVNSSEYNFEVANNAEYRIEGASGLLMTGNNNKAHGFITFGGWIVDGIEVLGFKASAGDDITNAAAGETWEFSCDYGYIVWKNWGA